MFRGTDASANTDHCLLIATIAIPFRLVLYKRKIQLVFNAQSVREDQGRTTEYSIAIKNKFPSLGDLPEDVETASAVISSAFCTAAYRRYRCKPWLSDEALDVIEAKA